MTAARDELRRLVEQLPEDQVSTALLDLQRLATSQRTHPGRVVRIDHRWAT